VGGRPLRLREVGAARRVEVELQDQDIVRASIANRDLPLVNAMTIARAAHRPTRRLIGFIQKTAEPILHDWILRFRLLLRRPPRIRNDLVGVQIRPRRTAGDEDDRQQKNEYDENELDRSIRTSETAEM
jgi:hypothetical protein